MINHNFKSKEKALAQPETAQGTNIRAATLIGLKTCLIVIIITFYKRALNKPTQNV